MLDFVERRDVELDFDITDDFRTRLAAAIHNAQLAETTIHEIGAGDAKD